MNFISAIINASLETKGVTLGFLSSVKRAQRYRYFQGQGVARGIG